MGHKKQGLDLSLEQDETLRSSPNRERLIQNQTKLRRNSGSVYKGEIPVRAVTGIECCCGKVKAVVVRGLSSTEYSGRSRIEYPTLGLQELL